VTLKLYPAIVTLHLLGGLLLLALLAVQHEAYRDRPAGAGAGAAPCHRRWCWRCCWLQVALGGWVSTNYAVLACTRLPAVQRRSGGPMDFGEGFTLLRELGQRRATAATSPSRRWWPSTWCTALFAIVVAAALLWLAWRLCARPVPCCGASVRRWRRCCWRRWPAGCPTSCSTGRSGRGAGALGRRGGAGAGADAAAGAIARALAALQPAARSCGGACLESRPP
jgi:hypothetical protein